MPSTRFPGVASRWRNKFKQTFWPLIWLAGVVMIIYYAPPGYRSLKLEDGEEVIGFRGPSHELITVTGGSRLAERQKPAPIQTGVPMSPRHLWNREMRRLDAKSNPLVLGNIIHLWDLDSKVKRDLTGGTSLDILSITPCANGSRIFVDYRLKNPHSGTLRWPDRIAVFDGQTGKSVFRTVESVGGTAA